MKFFYRAKKGLEEIVEGTVEAVNQQEVLNRLFSEGLHPLSVEQVEATGQVTSSAKRRHKFKLFQAKITSRQVLIFVQKLTTLTRAKVDLLHALRIIHEQTEDVLLQNVILDIYNATREGKTFSESLSRFPQVFPSLFVSIIKSGEMSGKLDSALKQISDFLARQENLKSKIAVALAYPSLLLFVGMASVFMLINFVIPRLSPIFAGLGEQLPLITKIILKISEISNQSWLIVGSGACVLFFVMYAQRGKPFFRNIMARIKVNLPVVNKLVKNQEIVQFSRSLCLLLNSGVSALKSLEIATPGVENPKLRKGLELVYEQVAQGQGFSKSIAAFTDFPDFFVKMMAIGEESGRLPEVLDEISQSYIQQVESDIALISALIEPLLILFIGLILGGIVLAILLPTFQITQLIN